MRIRNYNPETDLEALREMHAAQGFDYIFPNFDHPEFFSRLVIEDDEGRPVMAIMGRLTAEMFLLMDPKAGTAAQRLSGFLHLHQASEQDMRAQGIQDCFCQIPPGRVMGKFKRLLQLLGWVRADTWQNWTKPQLELCPAFPERLRNLVGASARTKGGYLYGEEGTATGSRHEPTALQHSEPVHF